MTNSIFSLCFKYLKYVLQENKVSTISGTICMRAMKCMHNFNYLVRFNILDQFFFEKRVDRNGRVETAVVVGIMQLVVRWKGEVLANLLKGIAHSLKA